MSGVFYNFYLPHLSALDSDWHLILALSGRSEWGQLRPHRGLLLSWRRSPMAWVATATSSLLIEHTNSFSVSYLSFPFACCIHVHCSIMAKPDFYFRNKLCETRTLYDKLISFFRTRDRGGLKQHCVLFPFSPLSFFLSPDRGIYREW